MKEVIEFRSVPVRYMYLVVKSTFARRESRFFYLVVPVAIRGSLDSHSSVSLAALAFERVSSVNSGRCELFSFGFISKEKFLDLDFYTYAAMEEPHTASHLVLPYNVKLFDYINYNNSCYEKIS